MTLRFTNVLSALAMVAQISAVETPTTSRKDLRGPLPCEVTGASDRRLKCSERVAAALTAYDSDFAAYAENDYLPSITKWFTWSPTRAPFAAVHDFNSDGMLDVVIDGHSARRPRLISVLSRKGGYQLVEIESSNRIYDPKNDRYDEEHGKWVFIARIVPPQRVVPLVDDPPFEMKHGCFEIEYWQKAAVVFHWSGTTWKSYVSGD